METMAHVNVLVPKPVVEGLALQAKARDRTFSAEVREALVDHVAGWAQDDVGPPGETGRAKTEHSPVRSASRVEV